MDGEFYRQLSDMSQEALDALDIYETTGKSEIIFKRIQAVGIACADGKKLRQDIKNDLQLREHLDFQQAIQSLAHISTLTIGRGKNQPIRNHLTYVRDRTMELASHLSKVDAGILKTEEQTIDDSTDGCLGFEDLLHPVVRKHAYQQFREGYLRDAVLNAIIAVFDLIRERTGQSIDGQRLITETFSLERPQLVFSEITTESGRNDQKGFLDIFKGAFIGIRNTKAHSLHHDLDKTKAAQYLIFASLLARRVSDASPTQSVGARESEHEN